MTNFDKLIFSNNWIKICKETMHNFVSEKVVVLVFRKDGISILAFPEYVCDSADLTALRSCNAHYFMPLHEFSSLFHIATGLDFKESCNGLSNEKNGNIQNGVGLRREYFAGGKVKTFLIQDELDLLAVSKLESLLWK